ncbi:MAG: glycosyltransferase family 2 protein [Nanoarchaeota archaeon]
MAKISVIIPCLNEEQTVGKVVKDFKRELPSADIIVYDNGSTDKTVKLAKKAGAIVRTSNRKGKGNVLKQAFEEINSDIFITVDGDDTYDAKEVKKLIKPVLNHEADMVVGTRMSNFKKEEKRLLHNIGNRIILWQMHFCFPCRITDMLSGYRVMTRDVAKSLNLLSSGFTIETEMTIKTLENGYTIKEIPTTYKERPPGSKSKLNSFSDGWFILTTILSLFRDYRPMQFFIIFSIFTFSIFVGFAINVAFEIVQLHRVVHYLSLILACVFLMITIFLIMMGFIGSSIHASKREVMNALQTMKRRMDRNL